MLAGQLPWRRDSPPLLFLSERGYERSHRSACPLVAAQEDLAQPPPSWCPSQYFQLSFTQMHKPAGMVLAERMPTPPPPDGALDLTTDNALLLDPKNSKLLEEILVRHACMHAGPTCLPACTCTCMCSMMQQCRAAQQLKYRCIGLPVMTMHARPCFLARGLDGRVHACEAGRRVRMCCLVWRHHCLSCCPAIRQQPSVKPSPALDWTGGQGRMAGTRCWCAVDARNER